MAEIRIREVVANLQVVDGEALLTPEVLTRIVRAVQASQEAQARDTERRRRDTRIACCDACAEDRS